MDVCASYIVSCAVCPFVTENSQDEAEIHLRTGQGLVVEAVVPLLITQGEGGRQWGQLGSNVRLGGIQVTSAPQDRTFTWLKELWKTPRSNVKVWQQRVKVSLTLKSGLLSKEEKKNLINIELNLLYHTVTKDLVLITVNEILSKKNVICVCKKKS